MAKVDGYRYVLKGVGFDLHDSARALNEKHGITFHYADSSRDRMFANIPAKTRSASDSQVASWPELSAYRDGKHWSDDSGKAHYIDKPYLLWIREDLASEVSQ